MDWVPYIGIPYTEVNCWDLVRKIYQEVLGLDLGPEESQSNRYHYVDWQPVRRGYERVYDVLLFKDCSHTRHVGLVISEGRFIHNRRGCNSCIENYKATQWKDRLTAIYRHKRLAYPVA